MQELSLGQPQGLQPQSLEQPEPLPNSDEPPQQLKRSNKIMIVEQPPPLLPPNKPPVPQPDEQLEPPQNKRIRIRNRQLLPPNNPPLLPHPQLDTSHIIFLQISFTLHNTHHSLHMFLSHSNKLVEGVGGEKRIWWDCLTNYVRNSKINITM